ncbi:MAG: NAD(P)-dependent glycerol-3-phosphate dehydrogenase [Rhodobacteraceae bacterium]|nr:NAD(P)-dependent glycerol-3-phosphate dehydrogenase [Paracoccaceae bacterium]
MTISVVGAGAFGTALAIALAREGRDVTLWARDKNAAEYMQRTRANDAKVQGVSFPSRIVVTSDFHVAAQNEIILRKALIACCKGFEVSTGIGPCGILETVTDRVAILTGPSFAHDIARGLPTALTLAARDHALGQVLQTCLGTKSLRLYTTTDIVGAELGGALKNVIAIACGATMGAGLGESARAALMTRGYAEMLRMAKSLGAQPQTLSGLSGFGDLSLTCMSTGSRNYRFGVSLGRGEVFDASVTVEGAATANAALTKAKEFGLDMPITKAVDALVQGRIDVQAAIDILLTRPQKEE